MCVLEGGYKATIKPHEFMHFFKRVIPRMNFTDMSEKEKAAIARAQVCTVVHRVFVYKLTYLTSVPNILAVGVSRLE